MNILHGLRVVSFLVLVNYSYAAEESCPANFGECQSDAAKGSVMLQKGNNKLVKNVVSSLEEVDPRMATTNGQTSEVGQLVKSTLKVPTVYHSLSTGAVPKQMPKSRGWGPLLVTLQAANPGVATAQDASVAADRTDPPAVPPAADPAVPPAADQAAAAEGPQSASKGTNNAPSAAGQAVAAEEPQSGNQENVPVPPAADLAALAEGGAPTNVKDDSTPGAAHKSGHIDIEESTAEKLKEMALDIMAIAKKEGEAIPEALEEVLKKIQSGEKVSPIDIKLVEDAAASTPGFAESTTAEEAAKNHASLTASDFATLDGGKRGEEEGTKGLVTFQGDMVPASKKQLLLFQDPTNVSNSLLDEDEDQDSGAEHRRRRRRRRTSNYVSEGGSLSAGARWTNGKVYYCFASDIDPAVKHVFEAATRQFTAATSACVEFIDVGHKAGSSNHPESQQECTVSPAIFVMSRASGCYSYVGMITAKKSQQLNLSPTGCVSIGTAIHELGHALGMSHEQSRPDRDQYVTVNANNVPSGERHNFAIEGGSFTGAQYDFLSIMHYDAYAFAVDKSKPTITQNDAAGHYTIGQRNGLSKYDVKQMETMYVSENPQCEGARGVAGEGCVNRPDSNGNDVCDGLKACSGTTTDLCCGCGGGFKVQCYKSRVRDASGNYLDPECPSSPALPPPSGSDCIADVTALYNHQYPCVFNNACSSNIDVKCPDCSYNIGPGGPRVQQCNGGVDTNICEGKCQVTST